MNPITDTRAGLLNLRLNPYAHIYVFTNHLRATQRAVTTPANDVTVKYPMYTS